MSKSTRLRQRWDMRPYQSIASVGYDRGALDVCFADGSCVHVWAGDLVPNRTSVLDWEGLTFTDSEIAVPAAGGPVEISWLAIRLLTDPAFDAHWREMAAAEDRQIGAQIAELRYRRGVTHRELAGRTGLSVETVRQIEAGLVPADLDTLEDILTALGADLDALVIDADHSVAAPSTS